MPAFLPEVLRSAKARLTNHTRAVRMNDSFACHVPDSAAVYNLHEEQNFIWQARFRCCPAEVIGIRNQVVLEGIVIQEGLVRADPDGRRLGHDAPIRKPTNSFKQYLSCKGALTQPLFAACYCHFLSLCLLTYLLTTLTLFATDAMCNTFCNSYFRKQDAKPAGL
jgi:hypothetical protein